MPDGTEKGFLRRNGQQETGGGTDGSLGALVVAGPDDGPLEVSATITPPANQPVTVVDGGDVAEGAKADAAWSGSGNGTVISILKAIWTRLRGGQATMANSLPVTLSSDQSAVPASQSGSWSLAANQSVNQAQVAGTATDTNSGAKSAGTQRVVLATDQPALTNKLLVTPDSVALPANQSVNQAQVAGTATDTNSGNKSAGTQRVVLATDQPALTNALTTSESAPTTILNGKKTVTTAGTRVTLAASTTAKSVTIKALAANTGTIYVGDTSVAASNGYALAASETVTLDIANLNTVNLDASVSGEGVTFVGVN